MRIDFQEIEERTFPGMNQGTGKMSARMYMDDQRKIIPCRIHPHGSIGMHAHPTSDDINIVISGTGVAICDGKKEFLQPGVCHICPQGLSHSIVNTGLDDLVLWTIVVDK